jgi:hypothetical protein
MRTGMATKNKAMLVSVFGHLVCFEEELFSRHHRNTDPGMLLLSPLISRINRAQITGLTAA